MVLCSLCADKVVKCSYEILLEQCVGEVTTWKTLAWVKVYNKHSSSRSREGGCEMLTSNTCWGTL